jgi:hypothetical protein
MKMKSLILMVLLTFAADPALARDGEKIFPVAPTMLPRTERAMKTPGYWIARHPSPDELIMDEVKIGELNTRVRDELKLIRDVTATPESFSGEEVAQVLRAKIAEIKSKNYFLENGEQTTELFLQEAEANLNLTSVPSIIEPQFGFILHYADQRFLPTEQGMYATAGDFDFDELQNNALEVGTPVVILHKSFDAQWAYVQGPASEGWIKMTHIVPCAFKDIQEYNQAAVGGPFVVVTAPKADIFNDAPLSRYYDHVQMGTRFPKDRKQEAAGAVAVRVPHRREDGRFMFQTFYLDKDDVSEGYLPYTPRTIYKQAFALLNEPYGWGGMYGEQDCSRFLQQVFATVGVMLPRDSKDQSKVGIPLAFFDERTKDDDKIKALGKASGGASVLTLKAHIMLYLGQVDGNPYAIHAVWAYREPVDGEDRVRVINRVAVTDLNLGEGSKKGSLLKRLNGVRLISK